MIALYRHNGLPVTLGTPLLLGIAFYRQGLRLALALLVACGLVWGVRGPLYQAVATKSAASQTYGQVGMHDARSFFKVAVAVNHIAAQIASDTPLTAEERELLSGLYPLENGKWAYDRHADDRIGMDLVGCWKKWEQKEDEITALAMRLFLRNPMPSLRHVLTSASYIWCITGPTTTDCYYIVAFIPDGKAKYQKRATSTIAGWRTSIGSNRKCRFRDSSTGRSATSGFSGDRLSTCT